MVIRLLPLLLLAGCTAHDYATCGNARIALQLAERAVNRFCTAPVLKGN
ncbi:hypothetical protein [Sphingobium sp. RAC03]|nr:hypothetical protein [Sphingobium sp. RAC03]AOF97847.1 putative lipoprotein [Sphingobium sp. RAC03]